MLQEAYELYRKWDLLCESQKPLIPGFFSLENLGSVGRGVPLMISECFWKYMPRSQTLKFVIARPCWVINQALTPRQKGKMENLKFKNYTFLLSRRKDLTWMWQQKLGKRFSFIPLYLVHWFSYCFSHMEMTQTSILSLKTRMYL